MIKEIELAIMEVFETMNETEEFKRKFAAYINSSINGGVSESQLVDVISEIQAEVEDEA